jgi:propionyl-CoA carboxylase alpha chain
MAETTVKLAREIGYCNAATIRFLLKSDGQFHYLGGDPFLSAEHAVTEAATGLDLVQLQIEIAEGRRLPAEAPRVCGHAIGALLHAEYVSGTQETRILHVWQPPPATSALRIDAGVAEGMHVPPFDPLLAWLIAVDAARAGAIRKLSHALEALWIGGVSTNQELLLQVLKSLNDYPLEMPAQEASDIVFAAACVLYLEGSRHAQQTFLAGVPPGYRNNPYRDPFMTLRIGARDLAVSWRGVGRNQYRIHSGKTELEGEVLALRPGTMSVVLDGILREFRFREVAEVVYIHSPLGSRVIHRLSPYPHPETAPAVQPPTVPDPSKAVASAPRSPSARVPFRPRPPASS